MNNLCAFLFVYCGLPAIKIKSAEGISLACVPSLSVFFSHSVTLSLLADCQTLRAIWNATPTVGQD